VVLTGDLVDLLHHGVVIFEAFSGASDSDMIRMKAVVRSETWRYRMPQGIEHVLNISLNSYLWTREGGANTPYLGRQLK